MASCLIKLIQDYMFKFKKLMNTINFARNFKNKPTT